MRHRVTCLAALGRARRGDPTPPPTPLSRSFSSFPRLSNPSSIPSPLSPVLPPTSREPFSSSVISLSLTHFSSRFWFSYPTNLHIFRIFPLTSSFPFSLRHFLFSFCPKSLTSAVFHFPSHPSHPTFIHFPFPPWPFHSPRRNPGQPLHRHPPPLPHPPRPPP